MVQRHLRRMAATLSLASIGVLAWVLIAGVADAATRYRSGRMRTNLLDATRGAPNRAAPPEVHLAGPDAMAAAVGLMAILSLVFLVVTIVRRRTHPHHLTPTSAA